MSAMLSLHGISTEAAVRAAFSSAASVASFQSSMSTLGSSSHVWLDHIVLLPPHNVGIGGRVVEDDEEDEDDDDAAADNEADWEERPAP